MRHPVHPVLVHFPVACWSLGSLFDIASIYFVDETARLATSLISIGLVLAVPAMIAGLLDLRNIKKDSPAQDIVMTHISYVLVTWLLYAAALYTRLQPIENEYITIVLSSAGLVCLGVAGWYGGRLVYQYAVGVHLDE